MKNESRVGAPLFPDAAPPRVTWAWLWPLLLLALALRIAIGLSPIRPVHADQVFQYLEPAYRLVFGYGLVTWEWVYGIRSWLLPWGIAGVIASAEALGLDYRASVTVVLCLVSLAIPLGVYRLAQQLAAERVAVPAFLIACTWGVFLHYAATPMTSMLAACALIWAAVWMLRPATRASLALLGGLLGLALAIRFQLLPVVGLMVLFALAHLRVRFGWVLLGGLLVLIPVGLVDLWAWGNFLWSFVENFRLNFTERVSEKFGVHPWHHYIVVGAAETGGLLILMLAGIAALLPRALPVMGPVLVGFAMLHIPAHKEVRFITWVMPFGAVGLAYLMVQIGDALGRWARAWHGFVWIWVGAASGVYLVFQYDQFDPRPRAPEIVQVMQALRAAEVTGVRIDAPGLPWWRMGGYFALGHPVPVVYRGTLPPEHVSHRITQGGPAVSGFQVVLETPSLELWEATAATQPFAGRWDFTVHPGFQMSPPRGEIRAPALPARFPNP